MYRLLYVSVRGHRYLLGNPTVHPLADATVPPDVGTRFPAVPPIVGFVARELRGLSSIPRVEVVNDAGAVVRYGTRTGRNGTGERWTWHTVA